MQLGVLVVSFFHTPLLTRNVEEIEWNDGVMLWDEVISRASHVQERFPKQKNSFVHLPCRK